jgi:hydroxyacylglutathione hydrolase
VRSVAAGLPRQPGYYRTTMKRILERDAAIDAIEIANVNRVGPTLGPQRGVRGRISIPIMAAMVVLLAFAIACALTAPYLFVEYALPRHGVLVAAAEHRRVAGQWYDDYFVVETIGPGTYAIGEPRYYQGNYSYLIVGSTRSILFDSGSGNHDIVPVVRSLTALPVTVIASHFHFDHVGAINEFDRTAALDVDDLRDRSTMNRLRLGRYEFLGFADNLATPTIRVDEWLKPGEAIDLGNRRLIVLHTPGHTPTSLSLYDADRRLLFCGDFIYPGDIYAFVPGASRTQYRRTTERLLGTIDAATQIIAAHPADNADIITAPRLTTGDLHDLLKTLMSIDAGTAVSSRFYPRVFAVNSSMRFVTGFSWNNQ